MKRKNKMLIQKLKDFINEIKNNFGIRCAILFGSQARGDFLPYSDIDLIVIGNFKEKFINRGINIYKKFESNQSIDVFCYTPEEFETMFFKGVVSILDGLDEGICLFGEEFFDNYHTKLLKLKKLGLKKDPPIWILPKTMIID